MSQPPLAPDTPRILVIDDEQGLRDFLTYELTGRGYAVTAAASAEEALRRLASSRFDLVISDVRMPGMDGLRLMKEVKERFPGVEVLITTAYGSVESAVGAIKDGAFDFLPKPVEAEHMAAAVRHALVAGRLKSAVALYSSSMALLRSLELSDLLPEVAELSRRLLGADRAAVFLAEDGGMRLAAESSASPGGDGLGPLLAAACADGRGASNATTLLQPLTAGGETFGCLAAARAPGGAPFSDVDARHAALLADQTAQAVLFQRLRSTQDRLQQSEKLNLAGRLAAGIAHELCTPLNIALGNVQLVLEEEGLTPEARENLRIAEQQAKRCAGIMASLLDFTRPRGSRMQELELLPLLEEAAALARLDARKDARILLALAARPPRVRGDAVQLKQAVLNLLRNALQAGGERPGREVTMRVEPAGERVRIHVEDDGPGIDPRHLDRLFEPFFTTKPGNQGAGLGLYLCRLMLERHGGSVRARNAEGGGAVFTIELPALPPARPPRRKA